MKTVKQVYEIEFKAQYPDDDVESKNWLCAENLKLALTDSDFKLNKDEISVRSLDDPYNQSFLDGYRTAEVEIMEGIKGGKLLSETEEKIHAVFQSMWELLAYKNNKYGDSALHPINVFSNDNASNSITIRLDDKLSRLINNSGLNLKYADEFKAMFRAVLQTSLGLRKNDISDLIGYLVLLCASKNWTDFSEFKD